jgi:hypothetical protein
MVRVSGVWEHEAWLDLPAANRVATARFGSSVAIDRITADRAAVASPGSMSISFFKRSYDVGLMQATWTHVVTYVPSTCCRVCCVCACVRVAGMWMRVSLLLLVHFIRVCLCVCVCVCLCVSVCLSVPSARAHLP